MRTLLDFPIAELVPYIDWSPFFMSWELKGKYPAILDDPVVAPEARDLFEKARAMLDRLVADHSLQAHAVYGFFPANSDGDDVVSSPTSRGPPSSAGSISSASSGNGRDRRTSAAWPITWRRSRPAGPITWAPSPSPRGPGIEKLVAAFQADHDDYSVIMVEALADRLAEAFAELLHQRARREWGYGRAEGLSSEELIAEKYRGIRPAAGYPACPDHTEKATLWNLLEVESAAGIRLTESYAMWPAASVSGLYFAHPQSRYFAVDLVTKEQVQDYAESQGHRPCTWPSAGSPPTWPTNQRDETWAPSCIRTTSRGLPRYARWSERFALASVVSDRVRLKRAWDGSGIPIRSRNRPLPFFRTDISWTLVLAAWDSVLWPSSA